MGGQTGMVKYMRLMDMIGKRCLSIMDTRPERTDSLLVLIRFFSQSIVSQLLGQSAKASERLNLDFG